MRYLWAKRLAKACGDNVMIGPSVYIDHWENISIGTNVNIHRWCYLDGNGGIEIQDNVSIAHSSSILSFDHTYEDPSLPIKYNPLQMKPVVISGDVWIGCGVRILAGAAIASRSIVGAGAVVASGNYEPGILLGVPAKVKKSIT